MSTTPNGQQIVCPNTPPTPRHGPAEMTPSPADVPKRQLRRTNTVSSDYTTSTLSPPPSSPVGPSSPVQSRKQQKKKTTFKAGNDILDLGRGDMGEKEHEEDREDERTEDRPTLLNPGGLGLPTPAKTPTSRKRKLATEDVTASSKLLFPPSASRSSRRTGTSTPTKRDLFGAMPSSRTPGSVRRAGMSAGTIQVEEGVEQSFEVYTDTNARIPTRDSDPDNPFITRTGEECRSSKRLRQKAADKRKNRLGEDARREDGMVYVFRGKKKFRKFTEILGRDHQASDDEDGLKPSSIKPRLLFPPPSTSSRKDENGNGGNVNVEDEEAETDIEETSLPIPLNLKKGKALEKRDVSRMTPDSDDDVNSIISSSSRVIGKASGKSRVSDRLFDDGEDGDVCGDRSPHAGSGDEGLVVTRGKKRGFESPGVGRGRKRMKPVRA